MSRIILAGSVRSLSDELSKIFIGYHECEILLIWDFVPADHNFDLLFITSGAAINNHPALIQAVRVKGMIPVLIITGMGGRKLGMLRDECSQVAIIPESNDNLLEILPTGILEREQILAAALDLLARAARMKV